jgi:hypothetical protein
MQLPWQWLKSVALQREECYRRGGLVAVALIRQREFQGDENGKKFSNHIIHGDGISGGRVGTGLSSRAKRRDIVERRSSACEWAGTGIGTELSTESERASSAQPW